MNKIGVTGASDLLGSNVAHKAKDRLSVLALGFSFPPRIENCTSGVLDVTNENSCRDSLVDFKPDWVVHSAACVDLDGCEKNPDLAHEIDVNETESTVKGCYSLRAKMIYVSTDWVFDGKKDLGEKYAGHDLPSPLNRYGKRKREGGNSHSK